MDFLVLAVFLFVYTGMILGGIPRLALDRTGVVLVGMITLLATGRLSIDAAWESVDVPTMALLFGLMVVSAQFRLGGFYTLATMKLQSGRQSPEALLALVILLAAGLSALLANDVICLAMTPVLLEICQKRNLRPLPYLLALACASNIGSAATLIGNPQNMLIGQVLSLGFLKYFLEALVPTLLGLAVAWWIIAFQWRNKWEHVYTLPPVETPQFDRWQTTKGSIVLVALVVVFLGGWIPREVAAMAAGGILLMSRRLASRRFLALVDWNLLLLFLGLFVVNHSLEASGWLERGMELLRGGGIAPESAGWLFVLSTVLSNLVSNVPAVMLLLPVATHPDAGLILALSSTLAGNLFLVGSIANIIVAEQAGRLGISMTAREHAKAGVPVAIATLAIAAIWIWILSLG